MSGNYYSETFLRPTLAEDIPAYSPSYEGVSNIRSDGLGFRVYSGYCCYRQRGSPDFPKCLWHPSCAPKAKFVMTPKP